MAYASNHTWFSSDILVYIHILLSRQLVGNSLSYFAFLNFLFRLSSMEIRTECKQVCYSNFTIMV